MSDRSDEVSAEEHAEVTRRAKEIQAVLDGLYPTERLQQAITRRGAHTLISDVMSIVGQAIKVLSENDGILEKRITALEESSINYVGVFEQSAAYKRNNVVTHGGSAWIALNDVQGEAPPGSDKWKLMVKRGKDGKDAGR